MFKQFSYFKILISFLVINIWVKDSYSQVPGLRASIPRSGRGGSGDCNFCLNRNVIQVPDIFIEYTPTQFPFKVIDFYFEAPLGAGGLSTCDNFTVSDLKILSDGLLYPNQIIFPNSSLLSKEGTLVIGISLYSTLCIPGSAIRNNIRLCNNYKVDMGLDFYDFTGNIISQDELETYIFGLEDNYGCSTYPIGNFKNSYSNVNKNDFHSENFLETSGKFKSIKVSPNPVESSTEIKFYIEEERLFDIVIFDIAGKECQIYERTPFEKGWNEFKLDLSELSEGVYLVYLNSKEFSQFLKVYKS